MDRLPVNDPMQNPIHPPLGGLDPAGLLRQGAEADTFPEAAFEPPSLDELAGIFPQFEILELIGRGGMGAVYKVRQRALDRVVALKILPPAISATPGFSERFTREARALAKLNHPGIVTIHEFGQSSSSSQLPTLNSQPLHYFLMEYVDGANLRQLMATRRIESREALSIVPQICDALQYAHDQGVIHRDIKPENLLLDRRGRVKVADFGIAKLVDSSYVVPPSGGSSSEQDRLKEDLPAFTEAGKLMGTPQYMAPEQLATPSDVDHRADIYALGVVFHQMLTGVLPDGPLPRPAIAPPLDAVVMRALEKEPDRRYQTADEFRTGVENPAAAVPPPAISSRFSRNAIAGACCLGLLLCFVLPLFVAMRLDPGPEAAWRQILTLAMAALGLAVPLATTILGWVAVSQIHRSAGRLHGMWLALFDGLVFPLLLLDFLVLHLVASPVETLLRSIVAHDSAGLGTVARFFYHDQPLILFLPLLAGILFLDGWIVRKVWRAVTGGVDQKPETPLHEPSKIFPKWKLFAGGIVLLGLSIWFFPKSGRFYPASSMNKDYEAPVIGRIRFEIPESNGGKRGIAYDVKAWGDTQWHQYLYGQTTRFATRVDASRSDFPVAMLAMLPPSSNEKPWEAQKVELGAGPSSHNLVFSNGTRVTVSWTPSDDPNMNTQRPNKIQQQVMRQASEASDREIPVSNPAPAVGSQPEGAGTRTAHQLPQRAEIEYPYTAAPARRAAIRDGMPKLRLGMQAHEVEALLGAPDEKNNTYDGIKASRAKITGYSYVYLLQRLRENGAANEEKLLRLHFDLDGRLKRIDDQTGLPPGNAGQHKAMSLTIRGEVTHPGAFEVPTGASLLDALAQARGWKPSANLGAISVNGSPHDLTAILRGTAINPSLPHGAVIEVPVQSNR